MKKTILIISFFIFLFAYSNAQSYKTALGARLGYPFSISLKHHVSENHAVEAYVGTRGSNFYRWANASVAYQIHKPLDIEDLGESLKWYYGFGGSAYFWSYRDGFIGSDQNISFGVQGYIGLEYTFDTIPLNISVDWVPSVFINGFGSGFGAGFGALAARYVLN